MVANMCLSAHRHGKERKVTENFWNTLIAVILQVGILYWGGFFNVMIK